MVYLSFPLRLPLNNISTGNTLKIRMKFFFFWKSLIFLIFHTFFLYLLHSIPNVLVYFCFSEDISFKLIVIASTIQSTLAALQMHSLRTKNQKKYAKMNYIEEHFLFVQDFYVFLLVRMTTNIVLEVINQQIPSSGEARAFVLL